MHLKQVYNTETIPEISQELNKQIERFINKMLVASKKIIQDYGPHVNKILQEEEEEESKCGTKRTFS